MSYTKEGQKQRLERFLAFLEQKQFAFYEGQGRTPPGSQTFIICYENDLAYVMLRYSRLYLTARNGPLRQALLSWSRQEILEYHDCASAQNFKELDSYRYLLRRSTLPVQSQCGSVQMRPSEHPLVALAAQLGYKVYYTVSPEGTSDELRSCYYITNPQGRAGGGNDLIETLAELLKEDLAF